jgi:UDP-glucose 4-epimerase
MRLLVTGGAGFIGSNLIRLALDAGHEVTVLDDLSTGYRRNVEGVSARFVEGSLLDRAAVADALDGVDTVVHLAALGSVPRSLADPLASHAANATGTLTLLEEVRRAGVEHVIGASSSSVYGANPALPKGEREWVRPMSPYAVSKLAAEQYLLAYQSSFGLSSLAFRFFNVFGPRQSSGHAYAAVIPVFVDALLDGRPLPVNGDGTQSRDFTYVGTVCRVLLDAVERRVTHPEPVNLAFGTNTTLLQLIDELARVTGTTPTLEHRPDRPGDVRHSRADNTVLRALFPDVAPVSLHDGLVETVDWFRRNR